MLTARILRVMEKVLVAGANGTTGKIITDLLYQSRQYSPVAMVRKEEQREKFREKGINTCLADLEGDLDGVTKDVSKVIFAAGSGGKNVEGVDRDGAIRLMDEAKKNNVKKFVMLSSMGADQPEEGGDLKEYLKAKHAADEYLRQSGLSYTIVRPGALNNESGNHKIKLDEKLYERGEIPREDVAQTLVRCLENGLAEGSTFEILSGPTSIENAVRKFEALKD